jgi:hypothetical protein
MQESTQRSELKNGEHSEHDRFRTIHEKIVERCRRVYQRGLSGWRAARACSCLASMSQVARNVVCCSAVRYPTTLRTTGSTCNWQHKLVPNHNPPNLRSACLLSSSRAQRRFLGIDGWGLAILRQLWLTRSFLASRCRGVRDVSTSSSNSRLPLPFTTIPDIHCQTPQ